jgi:hypothetical protein
MRSGDIRVEDIVAGSITTVKINDLAVTTAKIDDLAVTEAKIANLVVTTAKIDNLAVTTAKIDNLAVTNAKINDLSAAKITTGTLDASLVTISSTDGKMTLSGNIFQVKDASDVIQVTLGKYYGSFYGMALGPVASPNVSMNYAGITVMGQYLKVYEPATLWIAKTDDSKYLSVGYSTGDNRLFMAAYNAPFYLRGDPIRFNTDGYTATEVGGNSALSLRGASPSYGGGSGVTFIANAGTSPSSNPTGGGIIYTDAGALKYIGTSGSALTLSTASGTFPVSSGGTGLTTKMMSMVTYTGNNTARSIAHGLGAIPDLILIIRTDTAGSNPPALWTPGLGVITRWTNGGVSGDDILGADATNVSLDAGGVNITNLDTIPYTMICFKTQT